MRLLLILSLLTWSAWSSHTLDTDVVALQNFYDSATGPTWHLNDNNQTGLSEWNFTRSQQGEYIYDPCIDHWAFINCSSENGLSRITSLRIDYNISLILTSFPTTLCALKRLQSLQLYQNILAASLPSSLGACLGGLTSLALQHMSITGTIPTSIGDIRNLQLLFLNQNGFTGTLPDSLYSLRNLTILDLSGNSRLDGTLNPLIGELKALTELNLEGGRFDGALPSEIGSLSNLEYLYISRCRFTGSIPLAIANASALEIFNGWFNRFSGSIPSGFQNILYLDLSYNFITGTLPSTISAGRPMENISIRFRNNSLSAIEPGSFQSRSNCTVSLDLSFNKLISFPDDFNDIEFLILDLGHNALRSRWEGLLTTQPQITQLTLSSNRLTGVLPIDFSGVPRLNQLDLDDNQLHGPLPPALFGLEALTQLSLSQNAISGPLPVAISRLSQLKMLFLSENVLLGTIPESLPLSLYELDCSKNAFTGMIPRSISTLLNLSRLDLSNNNFTGTPPLLPVALSILRLGGNSLEGSLAFIEPALATLSVLDVSSNLFTGHLPDISASTLATFVVSANCFSGSIAASICDAVYLTTLALDALAAGKGCRSPFWPGPKSAFVSKSSISGSIPGCLFTLPRLQTLHIAGNGLPGAMRCIGSEDLSSLIISWNRISGVIPSCLQENMSRFDVFDVSNNKLGGSIERMNEIRADTRVSLTGNRLSGQLSPDLRRLKGVSVLRGNIFACSCLGPSCLPQDDPYLASYSCGSSIVDIPLYVFAGVFFVIASFAVLHLPRQMIGLFERLASRRFVARIDDVPNHPNIQGPALSDTLELDRQTPSDALPCVISDTLAVSPVPEVKKKSSTMHRAVMRYLLLLANIEKMAIILCVATLSLSFVYGLVFRSDATYEYEYTWTISAVRKAGSASAILFLICWLCLLLSCLLMLKVILGNHHTEPHTGERLTDVIRGMPFRARLNFRSLLIFFINVVTVMSANIGYLYANRLATPVQAAAKVMLSLFLLVWNSLTLPLLLTHFWHFCGVEEGQKLADAQNANDFTLHFILLVFNRVVAPCISTALTSASCFNAAITAPPVVHVGYSQQQCTSRNLMHFATSIPANLPDFITSTCSQVVSTGTFSVPFSYSHTCTAALLENYAPVVVISSTAELLVTALAAPALRALVHLLNRDRGDNRRTFAEPGAADDDATVAVDSDTVSCDQIPAPTSFRDVASAALRYCLLTLIDDLTASEWLDWLDIRKQKLESRRNAGQLHEQFLQTSKALHLQKLLLDVLHYLVLLLTFGTLFPLLALPLGLTLLIKISRRRATILQILSFDAPAAELVCLLQAECTFLLNGRATYGTKRIFFVFPPLLLALVLVDVSGEDALTTALWVPILMLCIPAVLSHFAPAFLTDRLAIFFSPWKGSVAGASVSAQIARASVVYMSNPLWAGKESYTLDAHENVELQERFSRGRSDVAHQATDEIPKEDPPC